MHACMQSTEWNANACTQRACSFIDSIILPYSGSFEETKFGESYAIHLSNKL